LIKKVTGNRTTIRQRLLSFLTPEQLTKWDVEATKAEEFLGQKLAGLTEPSYEQIEKLTTSGVSLM
jgi:hypothetical protein